MTFLKSKGQLFPYSLFDFANSSFTLIVHAYLFPLYFKNVLFSGALNADLWWGVVLSGSVLLAAILAPFIGKKADGKGRYSVFLTFASLSFASAFVLSVAIGSTRAIVVTSFVVANALFYLTSNIYDSLLTIVVERDHRATFSSFAWGFGYIGGVLCFLAVYLVQNRTGIDSKYPYLVMASFYGAFGFWSLTSLKKHISGSIRATRITFSETIRLLDRPRLTLLLGYWLLADCISTVIFFTSIYASNELKLSNEVIGGILLLVQVLAFPNTYLMAILAERIGTTKALFLCITVWLAVLGLLVVHPNWLGLVILSVLTSFVIGSTQALMRAQYSLYLDEVRTSETFGWYAIATESASVFAPLLFGFIAVIFRSQTLAMGFLAIPLILAFFLIRHGTNLFDARHNPRPIRFD